MRFYGLASVLLLAVAGCEGITYEGTGVAYQSPPTSGARSSGAGGYAVVSPQSHRLTVEPIQDVLVSKGYVVLPGHTASRLFGSGSARQIAVVLCADRGERTKLLGTSRVVECAVTDINTDQTLYTGQGEHIDWIVELDFRGAVRAALANLPAAGAIGRLATASDIVAATTPPSSVPQQTAAPRSTPSSSRTPARPVPAGSGTGVVVSTHGYVLTSSSVVQGCGILRGRLQNRDVTLRELATDIDQGLSVLELPAGTYKAAPLAGETSARNDLVVVLGFPAGGSPGASLNVMDGQVVAAPSPARRMRISVGSPMVVRGAPALNDNGVVVAVMGEELGGEAQPAVDIETIRRFLDSYGVPYEQAARGVPPNAVAGATYTVRVTCAS
ncbi:MAG: trypsin-like peptidase domain-containing protein [Alphaproteobacteria bacterium]|nr:trypsin-like peptidase domain-containing protein [Alphaproteobacteria bacterium]